MRSEEFNSILFSPLMKTNEVKRYSGTKLSEEESLSQHITDMCMMSYIITKRLNYYGEDINTGEVLEKCLVHDLDELSTGDMPRNTKYANPDIKRTLDEVAKLSVQRYSESYKGMDDIVNIWENAKSDKSGFIVKLCDMLCVVRKASIEIEVYNNMCCLKVTKELVSHLDNLSSTLINSKVLEKSESVEFVNEMINKSKDLINDINSKYSLISSRYNITKNILEDDYKE
jgi:5'-deoxynucleotidase YfbR-like HD superfamily hydrolase